MAGKKKLTRDEIIQAFSEALKLLDYVHAFYEGGAVAFNRVDGWSDIDLYIIADETKIGETFQAVEKTLKTLTKIKQKYEPGSLPWPGVSQAFYKLEDASEHLLIDLCVLTLSAPEKFLQPEIHGKVAMYFNKNREIKPEPFDRKAYLKKLTERVKRLQARFSMFNIFVQKEINRGNTVEAVDLYHAITLGSLTEALRIKHNPIHHDFRTRYIHYELPKETVKKLEQLHLIKNMEDLQKKYKEASDWFHKTAREITKKEAERLLRKS